jgi:hypothetical protein
MKPSAADQFGKTAKLLAKGQSLPDWLIPALAHYSPLVGARRSTSDDDRDDQALLKTMLEAARNLERGLPIHVVAAETSGLTIPDCVEATHMQLTELIEYLESQLRPPRKGGPIPDSRPRICAAVCAEAWRRLYGGKVQPWSEVQPWSREVWQACEAYWQACGNPEKVDHRSRYEDWQPYLQWVKDADDESFRDDFAHLITPTK